ncbi:extracellular solute-binding protein [Vagococcus zengguangii]|uniref:Extracellular solute-binding protein n=1 Tax=Vagococcus zengguangii TaxID=2571750 RepID=A0A4D7CVY1_9ENTE|nr:extracellular solute-binding protein [Vagococcus zengguangii]QCI86186.1 extracellular solute-binding protein [Vagococcus zengguangii]
MKVKKMTKVLSGLFICSMVLTACGGSNDSSSSDKKESSVKLTTEGFPIVEEETTFTMMAPNVGMAEWKDMPLFQDYAEKTGINFDFVTPPSSDFSTKLNLALASGDLPDVIYGAGSGSLTDSMVIEYGEQGTFVALEDLIADNMPNFNKLLEENPEIRKSITTPDGHIYTLPTVSMNEPSAIWPRGPMWYRGEWLEALDVKELPKTTDEFYDLLVRMRDEDPNGNGKKDEIPLTDVKMESTRPWLMAAFGLKAFGVQEDDGKVTYAPMTENYKGYLEFMNKLYSEKLLDQEVFSQADEQKKSKGQKNQLGLFPDWFSYFTTGKDEKGALEDPMFQPLTSEYSEEAVVPKSPGISRGTFAITKEAESPEALLRWVDYFYGPEGAYYINKGPEGVLWEWAENSKGEKVRVYTDIVDTTNVEETRGKLTPAYGLTIPNIDFKNTDDLMIRNEADDELDTSFADFIATETESKLAPAGEVPMPLIYLSKDEIDQIKDTQTDLQTYIEQMEAKFITGVEPLSNWDKYVKTIESMGVDKYVEVYQQAVDRYNQN